MNYMKTALIFTFLFIISTRTMSQIDSLHVYDSLAKYSYLIVAGKFIPRFIGDTPNETNTFYRGNATGFFIRLKEKLFLVTAYHVVTPCDVYHNVIVHNDINCLAVTYHDTLNHLRQQILDISNRVNMPPIFFLNTPDIAIVDAAHVFDDAKINSIENLIFDTTRYTKENIIKYIIFGFSGNKMDELIVTKHTVDTPPFLYEGYTADSSHYEKLYKYLNIDSMYYTLQPLGIPGMSGAPVFREVKYKKRKKRIEFAGMQSGKNDDFNCAYIVKVIELIRLVRGLP